MSRDPLISCNTTTFKGYPRVTIVIYLKFLHKRLNTSNTEILLLRWKGLKSRCPICGREAILADDVMPGEVVEHDCGVTLEVVVDDGRVLLKPLEIGEDWGE